MDTNQPTAGSTVIPSAFIEHLARLMNVITPDAALPSDEYMALRGQRWEVRPPASADEIILLILRDTVCMQVFKWAIDWTLLHADQLAQRGAPGSVERGQQLDASYRAWCERLVSIAQQRHALDQHPLVAALDSVTRNDTTIVGSFELAQALDGMLNTLLDARVALDRATDPQ